jgi:DNA-binding NarL/FixJ family response regulator
MIRVLLAEDQALVRDGIKVLLDLEDGIEVTAVGDGRAAVEAAVAAGGERFDVAVVDVRMPVLMLTTFDDRAIVERCVDAGASAFLLKDAHPEDLARAVRWLVEGRRGIPGDLAEALIDAGAGSGTAGIDPDATEPLTSGQRRVLALMADGLTNGEIAERLGLTMGTVKNVVSEIYARLGVRDRVEAVLKVRGGR